MARKRQIGLLVFLGVLLVFVLYWNTRTPEIAPTISSADETFTPIVSESPALRTDLLDRIKNLQYTGSRRNIFSAELPPPPPAPKPVAAPAPVVPAPPPGPPPLAVPATFFGSKTDVRTGMRVAFFSQGDDLIGPLGVGDVLLSRFRIVQISDDSVVLEEIGTGRRTTQMIQTANP